MCFVRKFARAARPPPCTPRQFAEQLKKREIKAKTKNVALFTSGKDQPFVLDKYTDAFGELIKAKKFMFIAMNWGDAEATCFSEVLTFCKDVEDARPAYML